MLKKFRNRQSNRQKGFTLIELLIVVAIIGIIEALQKAKQKRTVADERNLGTAMFSWLTDQLGAAAAGAVTTVTMANYTTISADNLRLILVPQYVQSIPAKDGWKHDYVYYLKTGTAVLQPQVMAIFSSGRDTSTPATTYDVAPFDPTDYDQDIVWADGFFVRWPEKPQ